MFKIMVLKPIIYGGNAVSRKALRWVNARKADGTTLIVRGQRRAEKVSKLTGGRTKVVAI